MSICKLACIIILVSSSAMLQGQNELMKESVSDTTNINFSDTIFNVAFDSIYHRLGFIIASNQNNRLVKYFKYIGTTPVRITRTWTGDPHFICDYPQEELIANKIYEFTICFAHRGGQGQMKKLMGFDLSDGSKITLTFTGTYLLPKSVND